MPPAAKGIVILASSFALAYFTYRFVELPVRNAAKGPGGRRLAINLIGSVAAAGALGLVIIFSRGLPARFPPQIAALDHDFSRDDPNAWRDGTCFLRPDQSGNSFSDQCADSA